MPPLSTPDIGVHAAGRGPVVVLLHSSMSSKSQWRTLCDALVDRYRVLAIDLHGSGDTPAAPPATVQDFRLQHEVALVRRVLADELPSTGTFHLIGHSYGGIVALQM